MYKTFPSSKAYVNKENFFKEPQSFGADEDNCLQLSPDGLTLKGTFTVWDDLRFPTSMINPAGAVGPMSFDTTNIGFLAAPSATQAIAIIAQMPHQWKIGSSIVPHIHWMPVTTGLGNVVWRIEYKWVNVFETESGSWTTINVTSPADGIAFKHQLSSFGAVSGAGKTLSSLLTIKIYRIGGDGADTYAGDALLKEFDIHYEIDSLGSREEFTK